MNNLIDIDEQRALDKYKEALYAEYMSAPVYPLMPFLKTGLIHRTSIHGWSGIQSSGFIKPNSGEFPYTYEKSAEGYGAHNGYVCLFDFESAAESDYALAYKDWINFLNDQKPATVFLKLNRDVLKNLLIPNSAPPDNCPGNGTLHLPYVEAWYPRDIPVSAVDSYVLLDCSVPDYTLTGYAKDEVSKLNLGLSEIQTRVQREPYIPIMEDWS